MKIFEKLKNIKERIKHERQWRKQKRTGYEITFSLLDIILDDIAVENDFKLRLNFGDNTKKEIQDIIKNGTEEHLARAAMLFLLNSKDTEISYYHSLHTLYNGIISYQSLNRSFDKEDMLNFIKYGIASQFYITHGGITFLDYLIEEGIYSHHNELINKIISFEEHLSDEQILKLMTYLHGEKANDMINSAKLLNISPFEMKPNNIDISNNISIDF